MLAEHEAHVKENFPEEWERWRTEQEGTADHERLVNRARRLLVLRRQGGSR